MKNPIDMFVLFFVIAIMLVGLVVTLDSQAQLREFQKYHDAPALPTETSNIA